MTVAVAPPAFRRAEADRLIRVAGSSTAASVAIYGIPLVAAVVAYKVAGGGLIGVAAGAAAVPVAFIATGAVLLWKYGPGVSEVPR